MQYAVAHALEYGPKITCFIKDNLMKLSDGLFHEVFDEIALNFIDIEYEYWIVDIKAAKLIDTQ